MVNLEDGDSNVTQTVDTGCIQGLRGSSFLQENNSNENVIFKESDFSVCSLISPLSDSLLIAWMNRMEYYKHRDVVSSKLFHS